MLSAYCLIRHSRNTPTIRANCDQDLSQTDDAVKWAQELSNQHSALIELFIDYRPVTLIIPEHATLRWARKFNQLTQKQLATKSALAHRTIVYLETGQSRAQFETREKLLRTLGLPWYLHKRIFGE